MVSTLPAKAKVPNFCSNRDIAVHRRNRMMCGRRRKEGETRANREIAAQAAAKEWS